MNHEFHFSVFFFLVINGAGLRNAGPGFTLKSLNFYKRRNEEDDHDIYRGQWDWDAIYREGTPVWETGAPSAN